MQGEYNESSMDQQCVEDENYVPGCKVQDRQNPDGEGRKSGLIIDPTNPDNVPIGDYLRYICPEVISAQDFKIMKKMILDGNIFYLYHLPRTLEPQPAGHDLRGAQRHQLLREVRGGRQVPGHPQGRVARVRRA